MTRSTTKADLVTLAALALAILSLAAAAKV